MLAETRKRLAGLKAEFSKTPPQSLERLCFGFFEETDPFGGSVGPYPAHGRNLTLPLSR
jgi:hypothetical protein